MKRMIGLTAVLAVAGFGCGDDDTDTMLVIGMDGGPDMMVGEDSGPPDAGQDMGPVVPGVCATGSACTMARGCSSAAAACLEPSRFGTPGVGGADDPIVDYPGGEETFIATPLFPGGYCTTSFEGLSPTTCNLRGTEDVDPVCGDCATCIDIFGNDVPENPATDVPGFCAQNCEASITSNDCRAGYDCLLTQEVCFLGCQSDDECRIGREETNGVPGLQTPDTCAADAGAACTPADCGEVTPADPDACATPTANFDRLVYDTASAAICDPNTSRCTGAPSNPSATGGDTCTQDTDCEAEGFCIEEDEETGSWAGGTCTKFRCDLAGNECAGDAVCQEAGVGVFACLEGCTVGGFDTASDPATWVAEGSTQGTCREGYGCFWNGDGGAGVANNGACLPIDYNPTVTVPNVGDACDEDSDCFSPFGTGFCITGEAFSGGYCSVRNCNAPWFTEGTPADANACGDGGICVPFADDDPTFALCLESCTSADTCGDGLGCIALTSMAGGPRACFAGCSADADCKTGERCNTTDSECVPE